MLYCFPPIVVNLQLIIFSLYFLIVVIFKILILNGALLKQIYTQLISDDELVITLCCMVSMLSLLETKLCWAWAGGLGSVMFLETCTPPSLLR